MTFGFSEASTGRSAPQRWRDLEILRGGLVAGQPAVHVRFRRALLAALQPVHDRQQDHELSCRTFNPALGNDPCNGLLQPPGSNWCQKPVRAAARMGRTSRSWNRISTTLRPGSVSPGTHGNGKTAVRGGVGQFFLRERLTPVLSIATNPPFVTT